MGAGPEPLQEAAEDEVDEGVTPVGTRPLGGAGGSLGARLFPPTLLEVPSLQLAGHTHVPLLPWDTEPGCSLSPLRAL